MGRRVTFFGVFLFYVPEHNIMAKEKPQTLLRKSYKLHKLCHISEKIVNT